LVADALLLVHFAIAAFIVCGLLFVWIGAALGWGWIRNRTFRVLHVAAIVFVAVETLLGYTCPLTSWEDTLRATGREERSFIGRWLAWLLYYDLPEWVFAFAYCAFALAVVWAWRAIPPRARSTRPAL